MAILSVCGSGEYFDYFIVDLPGPAPLPAYSRRPACKNSCRIICPAHASVPARNYSCSGSARSPACSTPALFRSPAAYLLYCGTLCSTDQSLPQYSCSPAETPDLSGETSVTHRYLSNPAKTFPCKDSCISPALLLQKKFLLII